MPFPQAIAEAQRASIASDIREAFDLVEHLDRGLADLQAGHLINRGEGDLVKLRAYVKNARADLFAARTVIEDRPDA